MTIYLSCGHEDPTHKTGWAIRLKEYDRLGNRAVLTGSYCSKCFSEILYRRPKDLLSTKYQEEDWFMEEEEDGKV